MPPPPLKKNILIPKFLGLKNDSMILHNNNQKCLLNFPLPQNPECFDHPCHFEYRVPPLPLSTGIFYYYQTRKTTNIRNTSGMFLCCKEKANWAQKSKLRVLVVYDCGFIVCLCVLISGVVFHSTINMLEVFQVFTINLV